MDRFPTEEDSKQIYADGDYIDKNNVIEGLIFKIGKVWVANFNVDGQNHRCQVDYNPFTGEKLN